MILDQQRCSRNPEVSENETSAMNKSRTRFHSGNLTVCRVLIKIRNFILTTKVNKRRTSSFTADDNCSLAIGTCVQCGGFLW